MSDTLVTVEKVSKKFCRRLKRSLWYGVKDLGAELIGRNNTHKELRKDEFWAVKDISFEVKRGDCLGLIGRNGAGKTTLLKLLNGLIKPDEGRITMKGKIGALLELGAGFNPILTGKENIYNRAAVLGMPKRQVDRILDEIIDFAEIEDFIDAPVQNYSSGMTVRLGFAVAAYMEPDILIVDEVLAVGDVGFRAKCFNAIYEIMQKSAVILVSHSMPQISRVCTDIMTMNGGKSVFQGKDVPKGIDIYYSHFEDERSMVIGGDKATILEVILESNGVKDIYKINHLDELTVHIRARIDPAIEYPTFAVALMNQELQLVSQCSTYFDQFEICNSGKELFASVNMGKMNLNPGIYSVTVDITAENYGTNLVRHKGVKTLRVNGEHVCYAPMLICGKWRLNGF